MAYRVSGAYATAPVASDQGTVILGFHRGAILPSSVPKKHIDHLISVGLVEDDGQDFEFYPTPVDTGALGQTQPHDPAAVSTLLATPEPGASDVPAGNASKAEWVEYAVSQGMPREDAEEATRDDLRDKYGQ